MRTVLLRMAADQDRAERIRALYESRPDLTWGRIADYVGVKERSAWEWGKTGGIDFENVPKLAELFEVDVDYIWRGTDSEVPDLMDVAAKADQVDGGFEEFRGHVEDLHTELAEIKGAVKDLTDLVQQLIDQGAMEALTTMADFLARPEMTEGRQAPAPASAEAPTRARSGRRSRP